MRRTSILVASLALAFAPPRVADADIADLYLRKIRRGEKTFYQAGGWQHWRNRWEVFWEPNYYDIAGDWRAGEDAGLIVLLSKPRSQLQLTVFTLHSSMSDANGDNALLFAYLPFFAPFIPEIVKTGEPVTEGITGFQMRLGNAFEGAYGVVTQFSPGLDPMGMPTSSATLQSFVEANLPLAYLRTSAVVGAGGATERSQVTFRYDEAKWARFLEAGRVKLRDQGYLMATIDRLGGWFSSDLRLTDGLGFGYLQLGLHTASHRVASQKASGKFGKAYDFKLYGNLVNPNAFNMTAPDETKLGFTAEIYFQMPAIDWLAVFMLFLGAQTAALQESQGNYEGSKKTQEDTVKSFDSLTKLSDEDDRVYGGLTLGVSYNDPQQLRTSSLYDSWYLYLHYRLFY